MSQPKHHHYIPLFLLKNFTNNEDKVYFSRERNKAICIDPQKLFKKKDFYTKFDSNGNKDISLEEQYSELENKSAPIIRNIVNIVRANKIPEITETDCVQLKTFIYHQLKRSPELYRKYFNSEPEEVRAEIYDMLKSTNTKITKSDIEILNCDKQLERIINNAKLDSLKMEGEVLEVLKKMTLNYFKINKSTKSFIVGGWLVHKLSDIQLPYLTNPTTEVWMPVAKDVGIFLAYNSSSEIRVPADTVIRQLNCIVRDFSDIIAGPSEALINSLINSR